MDTCKDAQEARQGREAITLTGIPKAGWKEIIRRVARLSYEKNFVVIGAGLGFFALLSIFPMLIAVVSIFGLFADPAALEGHMSQFAVILPTDVRNVIFEKLGRIVLAPPQRLGIGFALSILGSLWAASKVVTYLFMSLNLAYGECERRSPLKLKMIAILFTLGLVAFVILAIGLVAVMPAVAGIFGLRGLVELLIRIVRWPLLALSLMFVLALLYRFGPDRHPARWRWISPGAITATVAWLLGSGLFSLYVSNFSNFNEIYGSIGTVIIVMLWFFLTCFLILLGAIINAELEHQTQRASKSDQEKPMTQSGAFVPDSVP